MEKTNPVSILATLRTGNEFKRAQTGSLFELSRFQSLLDEKNYVELSPLSDEEGEEIAHGTGKKLPYGFESIRTPGIIVIGWRDLINRYETLESGSHPRLLMKGARLILQSGISYINCH